MRNLIIVTAAAAALAACSDNRPKPVAGICKPFPDTAAAQPTGGAAGLEDCLHRWAYTLAGSRDDAGTVADAVSAACRASLARWNQTSMAEAAAAGAPAEAPSLLTGQPTNPIAEHATFSADRALFYVVQARAGGCKPPPRKEGVPAMTAPEK